MRNQQAIDATSHPRAQTLARSFEHLETRVFESAGHLDPKLRRAAASGSLPGLERLLDLVRTGAYQVTDAEIAAARRAGYDDEAIFESVVSAALGVARLRLDRVLECIATARKDER